MMNHDENGYFAKGNTASTGIPKPTQAEKDAQKVAKADLISVVSTLMETTPEVARRLLSDPETTYKERIVIRLLEQARVGERDIHAIKILLDRLCGPVKQKVELSGNIYDLATMSKEQKVELLHELRKQRNSAG